MRVWQNRVLAEQAPAFQRTPCSLISRAKPPEFSAFEAFLEARKAALKVELQKILKVPPRVAVNAQRKSPRDCQAFRSRRFVGGHAHNPATLST